MRQSQYYNAHNLAARKQLTLFGSVFNVVFADQSLKLSLLLRDVGNLMINTRRTVFSELTKIACVHEPVILVCYEPLFPNITGVDCLGEKHIFHVTQ